MNGTWDPVEEALVQAKARGYYFHAVTNGVNVADFIPLFKYFQEQIRSFQLTLDGPQSVHDMRRVNKGSKGSYDAVVRGIDVLLDAGFEVHVQTILEKQHFPLLGRSSNLLILTDGVGILGSGIPWVELNICMMSCCW